jgi:hypothetical protein
MQHACCTTFFVSANTRGSLKYTWGEKYPIKKVEESTLKGEGTCTTTNEQKKMGTNEPRRASVGDDGCLKLRRFINLALPTPAPNRSTTHFSSLTISLSLFLVRTGSQNKEWAEELSKVV